MPAPVSARRRIEEARRYVLSGVTLIDGTGAPPLSRAVVVVDGERIAYAGPATDAPGDLLRGAEAVELPGHSVLPGLVNSHDHLSMKGLLTTPGLERAYYDLYRQPAAYQVLRSARGALRCLAEGQTSVRDCGAMDQLVLATRDAVRAKVLVGPRIYTCGSPISIPYSGEGVKPAGMTVDAAGPDGVRSAAEELLRGGADFLKIKGHRLDFGRKDGTRLFSEPELRAAVDVAKKAGVKVTFHAWHVPIIRAAVDLGADAVEHGNPLADEPRLAGEMARRGTFLIPNVWSWSKDRTSDPERVQRTGVAVERIWDSVEVAIAAGVELGVGTDLHNDSMVDEMEVLVQLGLSRLDCIRAATLNGARILGIDDQLGTVARGKLADIVVVPGDPSEDLGVLRVPTLVISGGTRHEPATLWRSIGEAAHFPAVTEPVSADAPLRAS